MMNDVLELRRVLQEEDSKNDTSSVEVTSSPTPALNTIDTTQTYQSYDTFPSQSVLGFVFVVVIIAIVYYCRRKLTKQPASASYSRVPVNEETARRDDPEDDFEDWPDDDIELSKVQRNGGSSIPHVTNLTLSPKASSAPPRALSPVGTIAPPVIKPISTSSSGELRSRSTSRNSASNAKTLRPTSLDPNVDIFETIGIGAAPKFNTSSAPVSKPETRRTLQDKVGDLEVGDASSWNDDDLDLE